MTSVKYYLIGIVFLFGLMEGLHSEEVRTWKDVSGKFSIQAEFVSKEGDKVVLKRDNGKTLSILISKLSPEDQKYLAEMAENPFSAAEAETNKNISSNKKSTLGDSSSNNTIDDSDEIQGGSRTGEQKLSSGEQVDWSVTPDIVELSAPPTQSVMIPIPNDEQFKKSFVFPNERLFIGNNQSNRAVFCFRNGNTLTGNDFLVTSDLKTKESRIWEFPFQITGCDLSPDGNKFLCIQERKPKNGGFNKKEVLCVFDISGETPVIAKRFMPYLPNTKDSRSTRFQNTEFQNAAWADDSHIFTEQRGQIVYWDLDAMQSKYSFSALWSTFAFSPNRKLFTISQKNRIEIRETSSGKLLGVLPLSNQLLLRSAFSPSGTLLAVSDKDSLQVYEMLSGKILFDIAIDNRIPSTKIIWTSEKTLLLGNVLYDLEKGLPLCSYQPLIESITKYHAGQVWTIIRHGLGDNRETGLVGYTLPHPEAEQFLAELNMEESFAVHPGSTIRLTMELNDFADEEETHQILIARLKEKNIEVKDNADIELVVRYEDTQKEETISYSPDRGLGIPRPSLLGSRGEMGRISLKIFLQSVEYRLNGKVLWGCRVPTTGPQAITYNPSKTIEDTIREFNKPNPDFIKIVPLPNYISKSGSASTALLNASLEFEGVVQRKTRTNFTF